MNKVWVLLLQLTRTVQKESKHWGDWQENPPSLFVQYQPASKLKKHNAVWFYFSRKKKKFLKLKYKCTCAQGGISMVWKISLDGVKLATDTWLIFHQVCLLLGNRTRQGEHMKLP